MQAMLKTRCTHRDCHHFTINSRNPLEKTGASSDESGPLRNICDTTGKISYATAAKAWRVIQHLGDRSKNRKVYLCRQCDQWHIGAWQKKPDARRTVADRASPQEARG
ncbi:MAG: hypothetical protein HC889_14635 [Synechococcaceae cyanobacterium SM1_2_3]|nr:hypothetical protein [Synechococcaceae cyanobacterium SM1_2_3]